jgi:hypothetical protein
LTTADGAPVLSILIPTKERYETLETVVSEITARIPDEGLEIAVCDNSVVPNEAAITRVVGSDRRVSYSHCADELSIVENTERGIGLCRGRYVCFIGDDDLVSPHIVAIAQWLEHKGADCLIYPPARFWWKSVSFAKSSRYQQPGAFWLPTSRGGAVKTLDSQVELDAVFKRGGVAYGDLPRLYHGLVSQRALSRVHDMFGRHVPGSSPDMALCLALALTTPRYLSMDYPVTVFGASRNSGGGLTAARKHFGRIEDQAIFPCDMLEMWDSRLPRVFSEQIIYPQTIHEVLSRAKQENRLSIPTLYASLIAYEPHIFSYLWPVLKDYLSENPARLVLLAKQLALKGAGRLRTELRNRIGVDMPFELSVLPDPAAVMDCLMKLPPPPSIRAAEAISAPAGALTV